MLFHVRAIRVASRSPPLSSGRFDYVDEPKAAWCHRRYDGEGRYLPVQIELSKVQYLVFLKHARNSFRVAARLLRVVEPKTSARKGKVGPYPFTGFVTDALGLCALALVHAPEALPAIERALKRAREKK